MNVLFSYAGLVFAIGGCKSGVVVYVSATGG